MASELPERFHSAEEIADHIALTRPELARLSKAVAVVGAIVLCLVFLFLN